MNGIKKLVVLFGIIILMGLSGCVDNRDVSKIEKFHYTRSDIEGIYLTLDGEYLCEIYNGFLYVNKIGDSFFDGDSRVVILKPWLRYLIEASSKDSVLVNFDFIPVAVVLDYENICLVLEEFGIDLKEAERFISYTSEIKIVEESNEYYWYYPFEDTGIKIPNRLLTEKIINWYTNEYLLIESSRNEEFFRKITGGFFSRGQMEIFNFKENSQLNLDGNLLEINSFDGIGNSSSIVLKKIGENYQSCRYNINLSKMKGGGEVFWENEENREKLNFSEVEIYVDFEYDAEFKDSFQVYEIGNEIIINLHYSARIPLISYGYLQ